MTFSCTISITISKKLQTFACYFFFTYSSEYVTMISSLSVAETYNSYNVSPPFFHIFAQASIRFFHEESTYVYHEIN